MSSVISIVTSSPRKQAEIAKYIHGQIKYKFLSANIIEKQGSAEEIITEKLKDAYKLVKGPVIVEDYSLYIDLLHGFPGPYVKSLLSTNALNSITKTLSVNGDIFCRSECIYGYMNNEKEVFIFKASMRGRLLPLDRDTQGLFGVDQLLVLDGAPGPYIDLTEEQKNKFSVRKQAIEKLVAHIRNMNS